MCVNSFQDMVRELVHVCDGGDFKRDDVPLVAEGSDLTEYPDVSVLPHSYSSLFLWGIILYKTNTNRAKSI